MNLAFYFIHYFQKYRVLLKFFENYGVFSLLLFLFLDSTYILIISLIPQHFSLTIFISS